MVNVTKKCLLLFIFYKTHSIWFQLFYLKYTTKVMPVDEFVINVIIDKYSFCIQSIFYHFLFKYSKIS